MSAGTAFFRWFTQVSLFAKAPHHASSGNSSLESIPDRHAKMSLAIAFDTRVYLII